MTETETLREMATALRGWRDNEPSPGPVDELAAVVAYMADLLAVVIEEITSAR